LLISSRPAYDTVSAPSTPWRDQVAAIGLDRAVRAVRDAGLELSGYCRGGMFTSEAAHRIEARDDNRRAVDEAKALGAPCIVLGVGGATILAAGERGLKEYRASPNAGRRRHRRI
jgi:sugar phosphate isomerase/epimerase